MATNSSTQLPPKGGLYLPSLWVCVGLSGSFWRNRIWQKWQWVIWSYKASLVPLFSLKLLVLTEVSSGAMSNSVERLMWQRNWGYAPTACSEPPQKHILQPQPSLRRLSLANSSTATPWETLSQNYPFVHQQTLLSSSHVLGDVPHPRNTGGQVRGCIYFHGSNTLKG